MDVRHVNVTDGNKIILSFWCDATNCEFCPIRFKCFTSKNEVTVSVKDADIADLSKQYWRLRDGSSDFRKRENDRPHFPRGVC